MKKVLLRSAYVTTEKDSNHEIPRGSIVNVIELGKPESDSLVSHPDCKGFHFWNRDMVDAGEFYDLNQREIELYRNEILYRNAMDAGWRQQMPKEKALALLVTGLFEIKREQDKCEIERVMRAPSIPVINMDARAAEVIKEMGVSGCMTGNPEPMTATEVRIRNEQRKGLRK